MKVTVSPSFKGVVLIGRNKGCSIQGDREG